MAKFSRLEEMAKAMAASDRVINQLDMWNTISPEMRRRYKVLSAAALENLRNPTSAQVARIKARYKDLSADKIRQIWRDMVDEVAGRPR